MMDLTIDEKMLILLYSPGTRMGLYGALQQMKEQLEEDETELLDSERTGRYHECVAGKAVHVSAGCADRL